MDNKRKRYHELDLDLIKEYGFPTQDPSGEDLSKREFITPEKIEVINQISFELMGDLSKSFLKEVKV